MLSITNLTLHSFDLRDWKFCILPMYKNIALSFTEFSESVISLITFVFLQTMVAKWLSRRQKWHFFLKARDLFMIWLLPHFKQFLISFEFEFQNCWDFDITFLMLLIFIEQSEPIPMIWHFCLDVSSKWHYSTAFSKDSDFPEIFFLLLLNSIRHILSSFWWIHPVSPPTLHLISRFLKQLLWIDILAVRKVYLSNM